MAGRTATLFGAAMLFGAALIFPTTASAEPAPKRSELFEKLIDCRTMTENAARLACYDREAALVVAAEQKGELAVVTRQDLRETRRTLFGFALPRFSIRGLKDDQPDVDRIEATIVSARPRGYYWALALGNAAGTWETTEPMSRDPKNGDKIVIRKGVLGNYLGKVGSSALVRMRRLN